MNMLEGPEEIVFHLSASGPVKLTVDVLSPLLRESVATLLGKHFTTRHYYKEEFLHILDNMQSRAPRLLSAWRRANSASAIQEKFKKAFKKLSNRAFVNTPLHNILVKICDLAKDGHRVLVNVEDPRFLFPWECLIQNICAGCSPLPVVVRRTDTAAPPPGDTLHVPPGCLVELCHFPDKKRSTGFLNTHHQMEELFKHAVGAGREPNEEIDAWISDIPPSENLDRSQIGEKPLHTRKDVRTALTRNDQVDPHVLFFVFPVNKKGYCRIRRFAWPSFLRTDFLPAELAIFPCKNHVITAVCPTNWDDIRNVPNRGIEYAEAAYRRSESPLLGISICITPDGLESSKLASWVTRGIDRSGLWDTDQSPGTCEIVESIVDTVNKHYPDALPCLVIFGNATTPIAELIGGNMDWFGVIVEMAKSLPGGSLILGPLIKARESKRFEKLKEEVDELNRKINSTVGSGVSTDEDRNKFAVQVSELVGKMDYQSTEETETKAFIEIVSRFLAIQNTRSGQGSTAKVDFQIPADASELLTEYPVPVSMGLLTKEMIRLFTTLQDKGKFEGCLQSHGLPPLNAATVEELCNGFVRTIEGQDHCQLADVFECLAKLKPGSKILKLCAEFLRAQCDAERQPETESRNGLES